MRVVIFGTLDGLQEKRSRHKLQIFGVDSTIREDHLPIFSYPLEPMDRGEDAESCCTPREIRQYDPCSAEIRWWRWERCWPTGESRWSSFFCYRRWLQTQPASDQQRFRWTTIRVIFLWRSLLPIILSLSSGYNPSRRFSYMMPHVPRQGESSFELLLQSTLVEV